MIKSFIKILTILSLTTVFLVGSALAQDMDEHAKLLVDAHKLLLNGEYIESIKILDNVLEVYPEDYQTFEMKGIALSNLRLDSTLAMQPKDSTSSRNPSNLNKLSMLEFYKALEINPNSVLALNGLGLGFGNFGEYSEAEKYFKRSIEIEPNNEITQNYLISLEKLKEKYSLDIFENPTEKPDFLQKIDENIIPYWIRNNAGWWANDKISDTDFISSIEYLIKNKIIKLSSENTNDDSSNIIPTWIKINAGWWATGMISDHDFLTGIKYLIENNVIKVNQVNSELVQKELERKAWNFEQYIKNIQADIKNQKRYVENINPSEYVIIKYWKDYYKWNLGQFIDKPEVFPDRNIWIDQETGRYVIDYLVYINEQPVGLPIDHVSTLENSFSYWEKFEFNTTDGKKVIARFNTTNLKGEANIWVTWVVRSLGEGVLGHANLGKGVVEVAIGSYGCDGSFQLFDVETVEYIMTHELGHSIGLNHSANLDSIMYPTISNAGYAYCLLN